MADTKRAARAFEDFTGRKPTKLRKSRLDDTNVAGWEMGPMLGVAYQARRDGETADYFHEFKSSARPRLVARDDGRQLYIDGGKYKVTDRGIEDMPLLMTVNPSPRRGVSKRKAKPMAVRRRRRKTARRSTIVVRANPVRRRRRRVARRRSFAANPVRRRRSTGRRFRRNPIRRRSVGSAINFGKSLLPAIGIGVGAVGAEILMGYLPIPANFKQGPLRQLTKGVVAIAAGMVIGKVLRQKKLGNMIALGGVVIAAHDFLKEMIVARMPGIPFGGYGMYMPTPAGGLGEYLPRGGTRGALGYYSPGSMVNMNGAPAVVGGESPNFNA